MVAGGTEEEVCAGQGPPWPKEHPGWGHLPGPRPEKASLLVLLGWVGVRELLRWLRWFGGGRKRTAEAKEVPGCCRWGRGCKLFSPGSSWCCGFILAEPSWGPSVSEVSGLLLLEKIKILHLCF